MQAFPIALLAFAFLVCVPAALAVGLPGIGGVGEAVGVPDPAGVQVPAATLPQAKVPEVTAPVEASVAAGASAAAGAGGLQISAGTAAGQPDDAAPAGFGLASSGAALVDRAAAVAGQAAGAGALTVTVVAASTGPDGLRALLARPGGRLQQAGRFLLRLLPVASLPLFSRIAGAQVLDNPVRAHVHQVVVQDPGLSVEEVRSRAGIAWGTAVHHLRRLEANGLLVSIVQNARRRYFAANTPASSHRAHVAALTQPTARRVADLVRQRPGVDQTALCAALGLRNPTASKHLQQLAGHGLVLAERAGRRCHYHPTAALHEALGILERTPLPVVQAVPQVAAVPA